jgi:hypothetical protein
MSSLLTATIVFICVFAGSSFGQWLSPRLPEHACGNSVAKALKPNSLTLPV